LDVSIKFYNLEEVWKSVETLLPFVREEALSIPVAKTTRHGRLVD
jgi:hypothetical protein